MPAIIPEALKTMCHRTKDTRDQILRTIIAKACDNPTWTPKRLVTWISEEFRIKVATAYQWRARARTLLETEPGKVQGDVHRTQTPEGSQP